MDNVEDSFLIPIFDGLRKSLPVSIEAHFFSAFYREISKVRGEIGQSWVGISIRSVSGRSGVLRLVSVAKLSSRASRASKRRQRVAPGRKPGVGSKAMVEPRRGGTNDCTRWFLCRPLRALRPPPSLPRAHARGYSLPALRAWIFPTSSFATETSYARS